MTSILETSATQFAQTFGLRPGNLTIRQPGRLVRIYPVAGIGEVRELGDDTLVIGRDPTCGFQLADASVSRRHASIEALADGYMLVDHGSTNGTYVNDERIERRALRSGDRVRIGNQIVKFLSTDQIEAEYHETVYKIMTTDGLTQAYNKRYLLDLLDREGHRAQRTGRPLSIMMLDVDRFKSINDTYGHLAGDEVLKEMSRRILSLLRRDEVFARYGGEEFAVVMADTTLEGGHGAAERLRQAIAEQPLVTEQATLPVTASFGVATTGGEQPFVVSDLIERADQRLYAAKQAGRNRVMS